MDPQGALATATDPALERPGCGDWPSHPLRDISRDGAEKGELPGTGH